MPGTLTGALVELQTKLGTQSPFSLNESTLAGTNLISLLATYLNVTQADGLVIAGSAPTNVNGNLVLSGTATVLGMSGASMMATFVDSAGGDNNDLRALDLLITITPATNGAWTFSQTFPALAGSLFDTLTLSSSAFVLCSQAGMQVTLPNITTLPLSAAFGLSFAGKVTLAGLLGRVANVAGIMAPQLLYGPIAFTTDSTPLPLLALSLPSYTVALPPFPGSLLLNTLLQSVPGTTAGTVVSSIILSMSLPISGVGNVLLSGALSSSGNIQLNYDFVPAPAVTVDNLNPWAAVSPVSNALPAALRTAAFVLQSASLVLNDNPASVVSTSFRLTSSDNWMLPDNSTQISQISVKLLAESATVLNAQVSGFVAVPDSQHAGAGLNILAGSDSGFQPPFTFTLATSQPYPLPSLSALVNFTYPALGNTLPADLAALDTAIKIGTFTITVPATGTELGKRFTATATNTAASWDLLTTPQPLALINIAVQATASPSNATVSGVMALGASANPYSFTAVFSEGGSYTFSLNPNQSLQLGDLSASLGGGATPGWIQSLPMSAGTLQITPGTLSALTGSFNVGVSQYQVPVPDGGDSPSILQSFNGVSVGFAGNAVTVTINATWTVGQVVNTGTLAYPYTSLLCTVRDNSFTLPIPQILNPPGQPDPAKALMIVTYILWGSAVVTSASVLAAIYCVGQAANYSLLSQAAAPVWTRLGQLLVVNRWRVFMAGLAMGLGGFITAMIAQAVATTSREASNNEITPRQSVDGMQANGVVARDAANAVAQAYSLQPAETAAALAGSYSAIDTATALVSLYPSTYPTAVPMMTQLSQSDVFGGSLTPRQMAAALAASGYPASQVAPALLQKYGATVGTAALMAPVLQGGWQDAGLTLGLPDMAAGMTACNFSIVQVAPVIIPLYSGTTLNDMASALVSAYQSPAPASGMQLAIAFAAAGQTAATTQTAVQNALSGISPFWAEIGAVAFASGQTALLSLVQTQWTSGSSAAAAAQAVVSAQPSVPVNALTGNIYGVYSAPNLTTPALATAIKEGFSTNPPAPGILNRAVILATAPAVQTARQMAALLASAGYTVAVVAPAVAQAYPSTAGTAALLAPVLQGGYQDAGLILSVHDMASGLVACSFSLIQSIPAIIPLYTSTSLSVLTTAVVAAWNASPASASAVQAAQGLAAANQTQLAIGPALRAAMPTLTASQMLAVLSEAFDGNQPAAAALALQELAAGQTVQQASTAIVTAQPQIDTTVLAAVLYAVYSPPNIQATPLAQAVVAGLGINTNPTLLGQALPVCYYPAPTTAATVAAALVAAISGVTAVQVATALHADGYARADALDALISAGFTQAQATAAIITVYGGTSVWLIGNGSNIQIPTALAPSPGTGDFSLEIWVQANTGQGGVLICHQLSGIQAPNAGFSLQVSSCGVIMFNVISAGGSSVSYANTNPVTLFDGRAHYIAAVRQTANGVATMSIYLDGQSLAGTPTAPPLIDVTATAPLYVGAPDASQNLGISWVGTVWNVCLWSQALSAATVQQHAAAGTVTAPQTGLVGFWPLTDATATDQSGNSNNGTLQGGATFTTPGD